MAGPAPRFITPEGFARIRAEYEDLFGTERPKLVETIAWAAANGDRSENGDYIYGRKRLREVDRRLSHLSRIMKAAKVVDPATQATDQVRFGATVELADENEARRTCTLRTCRTGCVVGDRPRPPPRPLRGAEAPPVGSRRPGARAASRAPSDPRARGTRRDGTR
jgi:hypothetical protein